MLSRIEKCSIMLGGLALLAGCSQADGKSKRAEPAPPAAASVPLPEDEVNAKVGSPYEIKGQSFRPEDNTQYDEVGYGSWYGAEASSQVTANGEAFNPDSIAAAHKTLPMPSFVEVTNLDTGKTILVRVNDRGPFAGNRIVDLTRGAAQQLGVEGQGTFPVRVRRVNPPDQEKDVLRNGARAAERIDTPPALLSALRKHLPASSGVAAASPSKPMPPKPRDDVIAPRPAPTSGDRFVVEDGTSRRTITRPSPPPRAQPTAAPVVAGGRFYVQIASFSSAERARATAAKAGGKVQSSGKFHRVVTGPYASEEAARAGQRSMAGKGYRDARIVR